MKFNNIEVFNFEGALRGMRNPKESWERSDTKTIHVSHEWYIDNNYIPLGNGDYIYIGPNDMKLAQALILAGPEHAKFLRQVFVSVDITAPLYWWKEFDTYKVGTTANSTSTMHKIASKPIMLDCFEISDYRMSLPMIDDINLGARVDYFVESLEQLRQLHLHYIEQSKRDGITEAEKTEYRELAKWYWKELIRWLPEGWFQTRTVTISYANLRNMYFQRRNHKLKEWSTDFMNFIDSLPYADELIKIERTDAHAA